MRTGGNARTMVTRIRGSYGSVAPSLECRKIIMSPALSFALAEEPFALYPIYLTEIPSWLVTSGLQ